MGWNAEMQQLVDDIAETFGDACTISITRQTRTGFSKGSPTFTTTTTTQQASRGRVLQDRFGNANAKKMRVRYLIPFVAAIDVDDVILDATLTPNKMHVVLVERSVDAKMLEVEAEYTA